MHKERLQRCGVFSLLISLSTTISRDGLSLHMLSLVHACQEYSSTPGHIGVALSTSGSIISQGICQSHWADRE